jgi:tRNA-splicing ligase RtcB
MCEMDLSRLNRRDDYQWEIPMHGAMRVPGIIYASEDLIRAMDDKVLEQTANVAMLPGIVAASYAMPDAHWGYGFPIGGVAAFDAQAGGVVSAGGVGFDVSCGVRCLHAGVDLDELRQKQAALADGLYRGIPAGVGSTGKISLSDREMTEMLAGGAAWAIGQGYGRDEDLARIEENGKMQGADPHAVSAHARRRQRDEMGTLGSGNHYLEVQLVSEIFDQKIADIFEIAEGNVVVSIHCGSRGLGHQIGTEYLKEMAQSAGDFGIALPDRELACAPIHSPLGQRYLGAMRSAINCALANRQIITYLTRRVFAGVFGRELQLPLLYDVSHNTCKVEEHLVDGNKMVLHVHRKGATRAFGPDHPDLPQDLKAAGQPVLIGGSMGTASYVLAGTGSGMEIAFGSACHGAGRAMSRHAAKKRWQGRKLVDDLAGQGILIRSPSMRGVAEEAPGAYKDVSSVVDAAQEAGLARVVAKLLPLVCVKG